MIGYASSIGNAALGTITQVATSAATSALGSTAGGLASSAIGALTGGGGIAGAAAGALGSITGSGGLASVASSVFSGGAASLTSAAASFAAELGGPAASAIAGLSDAIPSLSSALSPNLSGTAALAAPSTDVNWTFICTPDEISWTTSNAVNRVEMFGTNNPPAISGTKGMREFSLNNAMVEGFTRNKKVESKVGALEDLLKFQSSLSGGYVNVPVYQVWANEKGYGQQAFFLMKSVQVKETIRDLSGDATRAFVDVTFVEVPAFQVDSGIDQAPFSQQGASSTLVKNVATQAQQGAAAKAAPAAAPASSSRYDTSQIDG